MNILSVIIRGAADRRLVVGDDDQYVIYVNYNFN